MCLAKTLALAFGKASEMSALYHDSVVWTLSETIASHLGTPVGRKAVEQFNQVVDQGYDKNTVSVEILDALEQGNLSATRFVYRANMLPSHEPFEGEYALFVKEQDGKIIEVHERLDSLKVGLARGMVRKADERKETLGETKR